jgi:hypothetical protein
MMGNIGGLLFFVALGLLGTSSSWTVLRKTRTSSGSALFVGDADRPVRVVHRPIRRSSVATEEASQLKKEAVERRHIEALQDPTLLSNIPISEVGLPPSVLRSLSEVMGLKQMTDIQARCFAPASEGKNLVAQSRTGSGTINCSVDVPRSFKSPLLFSSLPMFTLPQAKL